MSQKKTKGALFVEKLKGDEKLQAEMKKDPSGVLKKLGFDVEDLPPEVEEMFAGAGAPCDVPDGPSIWDSDYDGQSIHNKLPPHSQEYID